MPFTTAWANVLGDHSIGKVDVGALVDVWLALFTADPTIAGSQASEVTGTGYARINITAKMSAFASGVATSTDEINFGSPGSNWGTISYIGIMNAATAGAMRYFEQIPNPRSATSGSRPVKFATGAVTVRHV